MIKCFIDTNFDHDILKHFIGDKLSKEKLYFNFAACINAKETLNSLIIDKEKVLQNYQRFTKKNELLNDIKIIAENCESLQLEF